MSSRYRFRRSLRRALRSSTTALDAAFVGTLVLIVVAALSIAEDRPSPNQPLERVASLELPRGLQWESVAGPGWKDMVREEEQVAAPSLR